MIPNEVIIMKDNKKALVHSIYGEMLIYFDTYMTAVNDGIEEVDAQLISTILNTVKHEDVLTTPDETTNSALSDRLQTMRENWK